MRTLVDRLVQVVPSQRQLEWHKLEFYAFIHFGMNTFYDREWGMGDEDPARFNPSELNTDQWIQSLKKAGIKAAILTCKHHDGFCLWPSAYTEHSVKNSPYKKGKGDIVKEMAESCKKYGLKFGVYLSPWDRHDSRYGDSPAYNEYFINQLKELLVGYGELFSVWFDGACGEGANGKRQIYDWERYYSVIRKLQPNAAITICGPDVRWCGNEAGECRESEWNVVPRCLSIPESVAEKSQQADDEAFRDKKIEWDDADLGSRERLKNETDLIWYPAEVDTSIRPGWFYHASEDNQVKPLDKLLDIYYNSVGGNATLLLNIPPDQRGLIHENDVERLREMGEYLDATFSNCITYQAVIHATSEDKLHQAQCMGVDDDTFYQACEEDQQVSLTFEFDEIKTIHHIVLKEYLAYSQRIEAFEILVDQGGLLEKVYTGTVVGSRKICKIEEVYTKKLVINITASRKNPVLKFVGIYAK